MIQMEHELHSAREKVASVNEERSRLEEQIANMQSSQMLMQKQGAQLQVEFLIFFPRKFGDNFS